MRTGPTSETTRRVIVDLDKFGKKAGKEVWRDIAERLGKPSRQRPAVNVYRLSRLAKANVGKLLVVPGKVLAKGTADAKIEVACLVCSGKARTEIERANGKVMGMAELIASKPKADRVVIVG